MPEQKGLLGCEVARIASVPVLQAKRMVDGLYAGSDGWRDYMSTIHFANARHCYSSASETPSSDCFNELRVESLAVTLPASNSFEQYRRGSDAAFDAIVADMKKENPGGRRSPARLTD